MANRRGKPKSPPALPDQGLLRQVHSRLEALFGPKESLPGRPGLDELVLTLLSQHTNDNNRDKAFARLRTRYPTWEAVLNADEAELAEAIRPAGLAPTRAKRLKQLLTELVRREGRLDLDHLSEKSLDFALDYLVSLPGVGRKTAACVLLFSFGKPLMPVDVHIQRVVKRLGWVDERASAEAISDVLTAATPPDLIYPLHLDLIAVGRNWCRPKQPKCPECPLREFCPTAQAG